MSRRGYGFERETELWCCKLAEQDVLGDFASRSFRTATSGAATSSKGDVRLLNVAWMKPITFECKHLTDNSSKGPAFHMYIDWLNKVEDEAVSTKSVAMLTWAFKHVRTHRGEGRVQFAIPESNLLSLLNLSGVKLKIIDNVVKYLKKKSEYFLVYHDILWEEASDPEKLVGFRLEAPTDSVLRNKWIVVSRRHLEKILIPIREKYKEQHGTQIS